MMNDGVVKPFDFIKSLSETKKYIFNEENEKSYSGYLTNMSFSYFPDTLFYANEMNINNCSSKMNYDYYFNVVDGRKRYSKWFKKEKNTNIDVIMNEYNVTYEKAKEYIEILTNEQIEKIRRKHDETG